MAPWAFGILVVAALIVALAANRREAISNLSSMSTSPWLRRLLVVFVPIALLDVIGLGAVAWGAATRGYAKEAVAVSIVAGGGAVLLALFVRHMAAMRGSSGTVPTAGLLLAVWSAVATITLVGYVAAASILG